MIRSYFFVCLFFTVAFGVSCGRDAVATKSQVSDIITRVNDRWQGLHPTPANAFWHPAAYHTGNIAAYRVTGNERFKEYSLNWARHNEWMGAKSNDRSEWKYSYGETDAYVLFGDWQTCFQVYIDLYNIDGGDEKIARAREVMEYEMSTPGNDYWWWADGLYMVMPVMTKLYGVTGNGLYLDKMWEYFSFARDLMYDPDSGLFFRDGNFVYPKHKTSNGNKDFWARGNGWVFAALTKVLQDLPANDPHREDYLTIYRKMAATLAATQQPEGYWAKSIIDLDHAPGYETSGTAFFTYGFLWGVNNSVLDKKTYRPVIEKGWRYLTTIALQPDGSVGWVQPIGARADQHKNIGPTTTADFGVGAFLLAASEMYNYVK
jgi:rhamnogalacturonyl hydrolase YesR